MESIPVDVLWNRVLPHLDLEDRLNFYIAFPFAADLDALHVKYDELIILDWYCPDILKLGVLRIVGPNGEPVSKRMMYMINKVQRIPHYDKWYDVKHDRACTCGKCAKVCKWINMIREYIRKANVQHLHVYSRLDEIINRHKYVDHEYDRCVFAPEGSCVYDVYDS